MNDIIIKRVGEWSLWDVEYDFRSQELLGCRYLSHPLPQPQGK